MRPTTCSPQAPQESRLCDPRPLSCERTSHLPGLVSTRRKKKRGLMCSPRCCTLACMHCDSSWPPTGWLITDLRST